MKSPTLISALSIGFCCSLALSACGQGGTKFSPYKGAYVNDQGVFQFELYADGTGVAGTQKKAITWRNPSPDPNEELDRDGTDYIYITFADGKESSYFFPTKGSKLEHDFSATSLFSSKFDEQAGRPRLVYWGHKKQ
jgi:hypothetical protein